jgi:aspartyl-tRNA synthetase
MTSKRQPAGELSAADTGRRVLLRGWVGRRRDLGELIFLTVRDRSGVVQVLFDRTRSGEEAAVRAGDARPEDVVEIEGEVVRRGDAQVNREIPTGEIEVVASRLEFLARAETPPFLPEDRTNATEELRLEHRYIDLRRPAMLRNFVLRDEITFRVRRTLHELGFLEVETPMLTKSTPEGARDYLVPSRVHPGKFYALPQSPQLFKQILMVSGFERYFQIARCFRDEDLRADRQPEFTQIDLEMSFGTEEDVFSTVEAVLAAAFGAAGFDVPLPFPRLTYAESMELYGTDRPDLRYGMPLTDLSASASGAAFAPFEKALAGGGTVRGLRVPGGAPLSRKKLDEWAETARAHGASGLVWAKRSAGESSSPAKKAMGDTALEKVLAAAEIADGDLLLAVADHPAVAAAALAALRVAAAREIGAVDASKHAFCWVTEFPLFGLDQKTGSWFPMNHPFTSPREEDLDLLESDPGVARARAYDVVLDGEELGSGSIRIHRADVQERVFRALGISEAEGRERFGFLLDALKYGAPPHGGIGLGLDRICMLAAGASSLRDVIAFPKTTSGSDLMTGSPSTVAPEQLKELAIAPVRPPES